MLPRTFVATIGARTVWKGKLAPDDSRDFYTTRMITCADGSKREAPVSSFWNESDALRSAREWDARESPPFDADAFAESAKCDNATDGKEGP